MSAVKEFVETAIADAARHREQQAADALKKYVDAVRNVAAGEQIAGSELLATCEAIGIDPATVFPGDVRQFAEALKALAAITTCETEIPKLQQAHADATKTASKLRAEFDAASVVSGRARANLMDMNHRLAAAKTIIAVARNKHPRIGAAKEFR